jgi:hypothetical protein
LASYYFGRVPDQICCRSRRRDHFAGNAARGTPVPVQLPRSSSPTGGDRKRVEGNGLTGALGRQLAVIGSIVVMIAGTFWFVERLFFSSQGELKAGKPPEEAATGWKLPDKYTGYSNQVPTIFGGMVGRLQLLAQEMKR